MDMITYAAPNLCQCFFHDLLEAARLRDNEESFNRYKIRPRILRNVSDIDSSAEIFGYKVLTRQGKVDALEVNGCYRQLSHAVSVHQPCTGLRIQMAS